MSNALYIYGIVKNGLNFKYNGIGINGESVYTLKQGDFSALVHDCEEKPYISEDPNKIKELILIHNNILNGKGILFLKAPQISPTFICLSWSNSFSSVF